MQTKTKSQRATLLVVVVTLLIIAALMMFAACNDPADQSGNDYYAKSYDAQLNSVVTNMQADFTENVIKGAYVKEVDGKYEITLIFGTGDVEVSRAGMTLTGIVYSGQSVDYQGNTVTPVFGYYKDEELVTQGVVLTYSSGDKYVTIKDSKYYYVQSMTFTVDTLEEEYVLSLYVMAGNETMVSSMQFPYASTNGTMVFNSVLTLDLTSAGEEVNIGNLFGIDTLNEVQA